MDTSKFYHLKDLLLINYISLISVSSFTVFEGTFYNGNRAEAFENSPYLADEKNRYLRSQQSIIITGCDSWIVYT